jgi:hypothetical protein
MLLFISMMFGNLFENRLYIFELSIVIVLDSMLIIDCEIKLFSISWIVDSSIISMVDPEIYMSDPVISLMVDWRFIINSELFTKERK